MALLARSRHRMALLIFIRNWIRSCAILGTETSTSGGSLVVVSASRALARSLVVRRLLDRHALRVLLIDVSSMF